MGKLTIHHQFGFLVMRTFSENDFIALFELPSRLAHPQGIVVDEPWYINSKLYGKLSSFCSYPPIFNYVKYWLWSYLCLNVGQIMHIEHPMLHIYVCIHYKHFSIFFISDVYIDREGERRSGFQFQCTFFADFLHISTTSETITIKHSICIYAISLPFPTNPISTSNLTCN